jgi:2-dehydro-3-deoxyphosphogluconate aldolase/(4S)-4-hydroxy-2-oxoglutarate aldolase
MDAIRVLGDARIVPVVVIDDAGSAVPLAEALVAGGIDIVEITLRTSAALDAIAALSSCPTVRTGAGTVVTPDQVDAAVDAGASFIVSPGLATNVVERALKHNIPVVPGVATPSDLMAAVGMGLKVVKFFPAGILGGPAAIRALAAPFPELRFVPTGGVGASNLAEYLALPCVVAVGGSWMVERQLVTGRCWDEITSRSAEAVRLAAAA